MERPWVKLPRSSARRDLTYAKLLYHVSPKELGGMAFEGKLLKPGSTISESDLWPTSEYPEVPLLLEYAGSDHKGSGHHRSIQTYILWQYDLEERVWVEIARASSIGPEWAEDLKPAVMRALLKPRPVKFLDLESKAGRILDLLDWELDALDHDQKKLLLNRLYDLFTARMAAAA